VCVCVCVGVVVCVCVRACVCVCVSLSSHTDTCISQLVTAERVLALAVIVRGCDFHTINLACARTSIVHIHTYVLVFSLPPPHSHSLSHTHVYIRMYMHTINLACALTYIVHIHYVYRQILRPFPALCLPHTHTHVYHSLRWRSVH